MGLLRRHDAGHARDAENIALLGVAGRGSEASVSGSITTVPSATAVRCVTSLSETSTIAAAPDASIWVSFVMPPALASASPKRSSRVAVATSLPPHQALADEERPNTRSGKPDDIRVPHDPTLGHDDAVRWDEARQFFRDFKTHFERPEIPVVDPDQAGVQGYRAFQFGAVVNLDQNVHAKRMGCVGQQFGVRVAQARHDDENAVRSPGPGFVHLIRIEQKVLAQRRQPPRGARFAQIAGLPWNEGSSVSTDRHRSARLIGARQRRRVEIFSDQPLARD